MEELAFVRYLNRNRPKSPETVRAYLSDLRLYENYLGTRGLGILDATDDVMTDYLEYLATKPNPRFQKTGNSLASRNRRVVSIRKYYQFLKSMGADIHDPTEGIECPSPDNDDCKAVDEVELEALLAGVVDLRDKSIISLFLTSGMRISELWHCDRDGFEIYESIEGQIECGSIEVTGKGNKKRTVFFDVVTLDLLEAYLNTRKDSNPALFLSERKQRISKRAIQELVAAWCAKLGISHIHPHQLRHSFACRLANADFPSMTLKQVMGHRDFRTTNRYFKLQDQTVATQYFAAMEIVKQFH